MNEHRAYGHGTKGAALAAVLGALLALGLLPALGPASGGPLAVAECTIRRHFVGR